MSQPSFEPSPLAPRGTAEEQARDRDFGFGSVVSRESQQRLLNRDGSFNVARSGLGMLERTQAEILVLLSGIDETFEQTVHARSSYRADEIVWNARFKSMFLPSDSRSRISVDIRRVHEIEPLSGHENPPA
jgi:inward rectifier potassium channel